ARRAWFEGVSASGSATGPPRLLAPAEPTGAALRLKQLRQATERFLDASLPGASGPVAAALVTGSQGGIPQELRQAIIVAGLAHLLTVSGFHVGVVAGGAYLLARRALLLWPRAALRLDTRAIAAAIAVIIAWAYVALSGANVPALRAGVTISLVMLALGLGRDPFSLRLVALAAAVVLLVRPESLMSASFQLSFAAVTALVLLANSAPFRRWLGPGEEDRWWRLLKWAGALIVSSLVAELVLTPIAAAHFGRAGVYGVLANVLAIPLTSFLIMPLLALHLFLGVLGLAGLSAPLLSAAIGWLAGIATTVAGLPGASLEVPLVAPLAFGLGIAGALLLALLAGPLRLAGLPLLVAGVLVHLLAPRPDLFVAADGRQVGLVAPDGTVHLGRGSGRSFVARTWMEAAGTHMAARLDDWPGARCDRDACFVPVAPSFRLVFVRREERIGREVLARLCREADLAVGGRLDPDVCQPRWLLLDQQELLLKGATLVDMKRRRIVTQGARAGDHPWSPAALPGEQKTLLGGSRWVEPLAE
ncbi:MAG: ComEC/Rec2 family competence protein, partial [Sphingomonadaceae bacterium]